MILISADVEQAVIDEFASRYTIGTSIPQNLPEEFVRVVATGGSAQTMVSDSFLIVVETFAKRESRSQQMAADILGRFQHAALAGKLGTETMYTLDIGALPQNYPLPSVPSHFRYVTTLAPSLRRRVTTA